MSTESYFCKCESCKREIFDMLNEPPKSHIVMDFTNNNGEHIVQEHKRFCDLICVQEWVNKSLPMKN